MSENIELTAITKLRHAALWELSKRLGSQFAAAEQCYVTHAIFNRWVTLQKAFPSQPTSRWWNQERWERTKDALESLTGQTLSQLWPDSLRNVIKTKTLLATVEQVIEVPEHALIAYASSTADRLRLPPPSDSVEREELRETIRKCLKRLTYREREIVKLRYGLDDGYSYTLEEVGHIFRVSKDRIRQIEAKAIRKLGQVGIGNELVGFID